MSIQFFIKSNKTFIKCNRLMTDDPEKQKIDCQPYTFDRAYCYHLRLLAHTFKPILHYALGLCFGQGCDPKDRRTKRKRLAILKPTCWYQKTRAQRQRITRRKPNASPMQAQRKPNASLTQAQRKPNASPTQAPRKPHARKKMLYYKKNARKMQENPKTQVKQCIV